ncbi:NHLP bacteriocin export ABC transporter permease/ATPase subunit [Streptomyces sp. NPDC048290]|uniref:NHLP bacteriocin export ABC transporter permease/ATPase subunit n=1 Tax=Streptomyces sp. NPDC048290 TaxID=3155811 RepID=UPI00341768D8
MSDVTDTHPKRQTDGSPPVPAPETAGTPTGPADAALLAPYAAARVDGDFVPLTGPGPLWLVTGGTVDVFGVAGRGRGRWRYLCSLGDGAVLPSETPGPDHVLVGRPRPGAALHRLESAPLWVPAPGAMDLTPPQLALARGVDAALQGLIGGLIGRAHPEPPSPAPEPVLIPGPAQALAEGERTSVAGLLWATVAGGPVVCALGEFGDGEVIPLAAGDQPRATGATALTARPTADLLADGTLWEVLPIGEQLVRMRLDDQAARKGRHDQERLRARRAASDAAFNEAVRALRDQLGSRQARPQDQEDPDDTGRSAEPGAEPKATGVEDLPVWDAARLVADVLGITLTRPQPGADPRLDPLERIALASRLRTRRVSLKGLWWLQESGPLVGTIDGCPVALLWQHGGYRVVDPVTGARVRVTDAHAREIESTAVMLYRPLTEDHQSLRDLLRFGIHGGAPDFWRMGVAGAAAVLLGLTVPLVSGRVLGEFVPAGARGAIVQACMAVLLAAFVATVLGVVQNLSVLRAEGRFDASLQPAVWDRLLRAPTAFFSRWSTGELANIALGVGGIRTLVSGVGLTILQAGLLTVSNVVLQLFLSPVLTVFSIGLLIVSATVLGWFGSRQIKVQRRLVDLDGRLTDTAFQTLLGLPKLRVAAAENFAYERWAHTFARRQELMRRAQRLQNSVTVFSGLYVPLSTLLLYALIAGPGRGDLSVADVLTFTVAFGVQSTSTAQLVGALASIGMAVPLFERLKPILDEPAETGADSRPPGTLTGDIELRAVSFRYPAESTPVLQDVSLRIRAGEFVAVVGASGSGKTTLMRLLIGFEQPTHGSVRYDCQDLADLDVTAVRRQIGVVMQHARPLRGSILENIRGAGHHTLSEVVAAARMAGLAEDLARMPMGLHTVLSDGGSSLSGGQRQRVMIAQALVGRPRVLFFDEATSALDNETQRVVCESTQTLEATRVVIAHRLSTIVHADRVVVLDRGRIVESGPPAELLADESGFLHALARGQFEE